MNNWNMKRIFCLLTIFFCTLFAFNASAQEERDSPRRGDVYKRQILSYVTGTGNQTSFAFQVSTLSL